MTRLAFLAHGLADAFQLTRDLLVGQHDLIERIGDLAGKPGLVTGQAH